MLIYFKAQDQAIEEVINLVEDSEDLSDAEFERLEKNRDYAAPVEIQFIRPIPIVERRESLSSLSVYTKIKDLPKQKRPKRNGANEESDESSSNGLELPFDDPIFYLQMPKHNRDKKFKLPPPPKLSEEDFKSIKIVLSQMCTPIHFWFQTPKNKQLIDELHNKIDTAYSALENDALKVNNIY
jgi:hypothetical protein